jgi:adenine phosphoribosyltransferase
MTIKEVRDLIQTFPDFPTLGVQFKDISPVLADPEAFSTLIIHMSRQTNKLEFDGIIGVDARGFIFATGLALKLQKPFIMSRKESKLPGELAIQSYSYEYAQAVLTLQKDRIIPGKKYLIVDDVLATGSSLLAVAGLVQQCKAEVAGFAVALELTDLSGRAKLMSELEIPENRILSAISL